MHIPFREKHLFQLLQLYDRETKPLDFIVMTYFREMKQLGSKDRAFINDTAYALIRWRGLYSHLLGSKASWESCYRLMQEKKPESFLEDTSIPLHIRVSFPIELFHEIVASWGEKEAVNICLALNYPAPTTVRANALVIDREKLFKRFQELGFQVTPSKQAPCGIQFLKKINFFELQEFRDGCFEVQDEASQMAAELVEKRLGSQVLDFCAGSGGKTLAFAPKFERTGQIHLHDIRQHALLEAKKRLRRAGIQNAQILHASEVKKLKNLKNRMDIVLVDAPCTGIGTLRRNPDMKWKYTPDMLERLVAEQRQIFSDACTYVKPGGQLLYMTCSILKRENEDQVAHFLQTLPITEEKRFQTVPKQGEMDGFFAVSFRRNA